MPRRHSARGAGPGGRPLVVRAGWNLKRNADPIMAAAGVRLLAALGIIERTNPDGAPRNNAYSLSEPGVAPLSTPRPARGTRHPGWNAPPVSTGTTSLASTSTATSTSAPNPRCSNSTPETHRLTVSATDFTPACATRARAASGEALKSRASASAARTAPAPSRSSTAGRSDPSGQRSPAATTVTGASRLP